MVDLSSSGLTCASFGSTFRPALVLFLANVSPSHHVDCLPIRSLRRVVSAPGSLPLSQDLLRGAPASVLLDSLTVLNLDSGCSFWTVGSQRSVRHVRSICAVPW
jgi:hypothetical protein